MKKKKNVSMDSLKKFVRREAPEFLKSPNVTSVGIGYKMKGGKSTGELSVQFTVGRKVGLEGLEALATKELPEFVIIDDVRVPTDVLQRSYDAAARAVRAAAKPARKTALDPIVPGVSIGHPDVSAGTVGCVVYDSRSAAPYVLSNWHVLHGPTGDLGDSIVQPGAFDDNRIDRNVAGTLVRSHLGAAGDCAIAVIDGRRLADKILSLDVAVDRIGEPQLGERIVKSGRTTDVTFGIVQRIHITVRIDYDEAGKHNIGCFEIGPDPARPARDGEISMGGDSGAAWLTQERGKATTMMVGLHFAGEVGNEPEHALACYAPSVFQKLEIVPKPPAAIVIEPAGGFGFAPTFLGNTIALPAPATTAVRTDLVSVNGRAVIDYTHFSLAMSRRRRFARWVAWNIDGSSMKRISRTGIPFKKDPNVPAEVQIGDELYSGNRLDRGHLARRADLLWGPEPEAERANVDSFFFTNITPQHEAFNRSSAGGIWGELENAIFEGVDVTDLRVSVLGGPIFADDDTVHRTVKIPRDFWKVLYFRDGADGAFKAKGYVLTQSDLLNRLEAFELPEFAVFEVPLMQIGAMAGLTLPTVAPTERRRGLGGRRAATEGVREEVRRVGSEREILG